jgi:hypothetical protein
LLSADPTLLACRSLTCHHSHKSLITVFRDHRPPRRREALQAWGICSHLQAPWQATATLRPSLAFPAAVQRRPLHPHTHQITDTRRGHPLHTETRPTHLLKAATQHSRTLLLSSEPIHLIRTWVVARSRRRKNCLYRPPTTTWPSPHIKALLQCRLLQLLRRWDHHSITISRRHSNIPRQ